MYCVYCLQHSRTRELYYGLSKDIKRRLHEHRKRDEDWRLIYCEFYLAKQDAVEREQKLKHYGQARTHLKHRIKNSLEK